MYQPMIPKILANISLNDPILCHLPQFWDLEPKGSHKCNLLKLEFQTRITLKLIKVSEILKLNLSILIQMQRTKLLEINFDDE